MKLTIRRCYGGNPHTGQSVPWRVAAWWAVLRVWTPEGVECRQIRGRSEPHLIRQGQRIAEGTAGATRARLDITPIPYIPRWCVVGVGDRELCRFGFGVRRRAKRMKRDNVTARAAVAV